MAYIYTTLNDPLTVGGTFAEGINDQGQVVGYYVASGGTKHGFLYSGGNFTTRDGPSQGGPDTLLRDINNSGVIVGYNNLYGVEGTTGGIGEWHWYYYSNVTQYTGLSNLNQIVGNADRDLNDHPPFGFLTNTTGPVLIPDQSNNKIIDPAGAKTFAEDINNAGVVIGYYLTANSQAKTFYEINGSFFEFKDLPNSNILSIYGFGINDSGQSVGYYYDLYGQIHGWIDNVNIPSFTTIDVPGATGGTFLQNINNAGQIVGYYLDATGTHGFTATILPLNHVYRFFDGHSNDHFYTASLSEANALMANPNSTYTYEGNKWDVPNPGAGTTNVFRFYNFKNGEHFLTTSTSERDQINAAFANGTGDYRSEGTGFDTYTSLSASDSGIFATERFYNTILGAHHFSASAAETAFIKSGGAGPGWRDEGQGLIVHTV